MEGPPPPPAPQTANVPLEAYLLQGCFREADRAEMTAATIDTLRSHIAETYHGHMMMLADEIRKTGTLLRDMADRSQVFVSRVPVVVNYLNVVLPCLSRTLRDIDKYYEDKTLTKELRWRKMYNDMTKEAGGLPLMDRFIIYSRFLQSMKFLLTRDPYFDFNELENLRTRIMGLREKRGIPPPPLQIGAPSRLDLIRAPVHEPQAHWAEQIFTLPLPSRTPLRQKHPRPSESLGHHLPWSHMNFPYEPKILFRRPFENDRLCVMVVLNPMNQSPFYLIRSLGPDGSYGYSQQGAHELCISRDGSALQLKRWSVTSQCSKLWALLYFPTWEEMVLFYCTFVALKARAILTVQMNPAEYKLKMERRLFQAQIFDDGFKHSLIVYQDRRTHGMRLHAAVWEGELRQCPVWTAFITHQSQSPTWISRRSRHRIWLRDVQLYVFCKDYRQENMRQNKSGAFEINFVSEEAATRFRELFTTPSPPDSSDSNEGVAGPSSARSH